MRAMRRNERGQVAVYAVVLFPLLVLVMSLVYVVGNVEDLRSRIRAELDMAALTATQALDSNRALIGSAPRPGCPMRPDQLARLYLARTWPILGAPSPRAHQTPTASATSSVTNSGTDPITGSVVTAPTVSIRLAARSTSRCSASPVSRPRSR